MAGQEAVIALVADGMMLCSGAARALNMAPVEFVELLNSHGFMLIRPDANELQGELEAAESRTQLMPVGE